VTNPPIWRAYLPLRARLPEPNLALLRLNRTGFLSVVEREE